MTSDRATVTIERAVASDVPSIVELEKVAFSDPWSADSFTSILAEPAVFMAAARDGVTSALVGYVVAWFAADEGEIANLAVAEPTRKRGVGAALLDSALAQAKLRGAVNMYLEVRESNEAAQRLYASRGFEEVGRRPRYYRRPVEDAVVLRRALE